MPTESSPYIRRFISGLVNYTGSEAEPAVSWSRVSLSKTNSVTKGGPVPGYRQKIAAGQNCTTTLVGSRYLAEHEDGRAYVRLKRKPGFSPAVYPLYDITDRIGLFVIPIDYPVYTIPGELWTKADDAAKQYVQAKISDQYRSFQAMVFAGEGRETVRMIRSAGQAVDQRVRRHLEDVKRRSSSLPRVLSKRLDALANMWLVVQYGIKPLLNDIDSGAKALATDYSIRNRHQLVVGVGEADGYIGVTTNKSVQSALTILHQRAEWAHVVVIYRAMVGLTRSDLRRLSSTSLGILSQDFIPTIYELIPYSFLLDYFTNVNEIVNAWSWGRTGVRWCNRTQISEVNRYCTTTACTVTGAGAAYVIDDFDYRPCSLRTAFRAVSRDTYSGTFTPSLEFELPRSLTKVANIAALATLHRSALATAFAPFRKGKRG